jgi:signal transduction histidine kinase
MLQRLFFIFFILPLFTSGRQTDSAITQKPLNDSTFILNAFNRADEYMNTDHYDQAQLWLNKIYQKVSYRKPSLFSYFLTTRQAEVYYYNNLHQLGLQEAFKGENIATILKDSLLIADACNFIGLFYMNNNKLKDAIKYYKRALLYTSQPPYNSKYIELSKPHHIYGNLAEAFEKSKQPDSAIFYALISVSKAKEIQSGRGMATTTLNLGSAYIAKGKADSAKKYFSLSRDYAIKSDDFDVELNSYSGLADCASAIGDKAQAFAQLELGFSLMKRYPQLNDFYSSMFLEIAIKIYRKYNEEALLLKTIELKTQIQTAVYERNNTQIQTLLLTGIQNEKTIFQLELTEAQNRQSLANTRLYVLLLLFLLLAIGFVTYRYYSKQRLKVANLRSKISQDLHDEVGATLSGISMYSYITKEQIKNQDHESVNTSLDIIKDNAGEMVAKLNDIVWAVNPVQDNAHTLAERLKEFALQHTAVKNIRLNFSADNSLPMQKLNMEKRKNIYLICKEAINNAVKYGYCTLLQINVAVMHKHVVITIEDDGKGFLPEMAGKGNGLVNMAARAQEINAKLEIDSRPGKGTRVSLNCKIT